MCTRCCVITYTYKYVPVNININIYIYVTYISIWTADFRYMDVASRV